MHYLPTLKMLSVTLLLMISNTVLAGVPFVTDDPEPVEHKDLEVNYALSKTWRNNAASASIPSIDLNYGFTPNLQLHAQPRFSYEREGAEGNYGIDNIEIGVKYRFINNESNGSNYMVGIYPMLQLPTGDKRLGEVRGKMQLFLPVWAQYNKENWTMYGGTGYRINRNEDSKNSWFFGGVILYKLTNKFKMGGEVFRETSTTTGERGTAGFNLGGIYNLKEDYSVLFSAGKGISNISSTNKLSAYIGLQVIY